MKHVTGSGRGTPKFSGAVRAPLLGFPLSYFLDPPLCSMHSWCTHMHTRNCYDCESLTCAFLLACLLWLHLLKQWESNWWVESDKSGWSQEKWAWQPKIFRAARSLKVTIATQSASPQSNTNHTTSTSCVHAKPCVPMSSWACCAMYQAFSSLSLYSNSSTPVATVQCTNISSKLFTHMHARSCKWAPALSIAIHNSHNVITHTI